MIRVRNFFFSIPVLFKHIFIEFNYIFKTYILQWNTPDCLYGAILRHIAANGAIWRHFLFILFFFSDLLFNPDNYGQSHRK